MRTKDIAGQIMGSLEAFKGSRAAIDTSQILIVRGMSRKKIPHEELAEIVSGLLKDVGAEEIDIYDDYAGDIIGMMDENIRDLVEIQNETDVYGIYRMKDSFESMNCHAHYAIGVIDDTFGVFLVLWKDKSGMGPLFVEIVVSLLKE
jgi:hypothetical protein